MSVPPIRKAEPVRDQDVGRRPPSDEHDVAAAGALRIQSPTHEPVATASRAAARDEQTTPQTAKPMAMSVGKSAGP